MGTSSPYLDREVPEVLFPRHLLCWLYHVHNLLQGKDWAIETIFSGIIESAGLEEERSRFLLNVAPEIEGR